MRKYDVVLSAVESFYSIETADGPEYIALFEETMRRTPSYGERVMKELADSLSDADLSWKDALWNDDWHIEEFDSEISARQFVEQNILNVVQDATKTGLSG